MTIAFDKVDTAPLFSESFGTYFTNWLSVLVNTINQTAENIADDFNLLTAQPYTQTEITDLFNDDLIQNGVLLYDSTNDVYVGMQGGALVQFSTTPWP